MNSNMVALIVPVVVASLLKTVEDVRAQREVRALAMGSTSLGGYVHIARKCEGGRLPKERPCMASGKERVNDRQN
jgi:hypothetical protein